MDTKEFLENLKKTIYALRKGAGQVDSLGSSISKVSRFIKLLGIKIETDSNAVNASKAREQSNYLQKAYIILSAYAKAHDGKLPLDGKGSIKAILAAAGPEGKKAVAEYERRMSMIGSKEVDQDEDVVSKLKSGAKQIGRGVKDLGSATASIFKEAEELADELAEKETDIEPIKSPITSSSQPKVTGSNLLDDLKAREEVLRSGAKSVKQVADSTKSMSNAATAGIDINDGDNTAARANAQADFFKAAREFLAAWEEDGKEIPNGGKGNIKDILRACGPEGKKIVDDYERSTSNVASESKFDTMYRDLVMENNLQYSKEVIAEGFWSRTFNRGVNAVKKATAAVTPGISSARTASDIQEKFKQVYDGLFSKLGWTAGDPAKNIRWKWYSLENGGLMFTYDASDNMLRAYAKQTDGSWKLGAKDKIGFHYDEESLMRAINKLCKESGAPVPDWSKLDAVPEDTSSPSDEFETMEGQEKACKGALCKDAAKRPVNVNNRLIFKESTKKPVNKGGRLAFEKLKKSCPACSDEFNENLTIEGDEEDGNIDTTFSKDNVKNAQKKWEKRKMGLDKEAAKRPVNVNGKLLFKECDGSGKKPTGR